VFWSFDVSPSWALVMLSFFAALNVIGAVGYEVRVPRTGLRPATGLLLSANALVAGGVGSAILDDGQAAGLWLAGLALGHLALGLVLLAGRKAAREIAFVLFGVALTAADVAFALLADGPVLAAGWALSAAALAALARRYTRDGELLQLTLGGQLALAIGHTLLFEAPPGALVDGSAHLPGALAALGAIGVSAFAAARATRRESDVVRTLLDGLCLAAVAWASALALDGVALALAWAGQAAALAGVARRTGDRVAVGGFLAFLGLAGIHGLAFEAPVGSLVYGAPDLADAALALGAVAGAAVVGSRLRLPDGRAYRPYAYAWTAGLALYLVSVAVVSAFQPGTDVPADALGLGVRQQGQAALSALWSACGLAALWTGLARRRRPVRLAGFGLLALAAVKVFGYDLSVLGAEYRVLSFVVLGLLLLAAAYAYQRVERRLPLGR
jgi:hypothetical protein